LTITTFFYGSFIFLRRANANISKSPPSLPSIICLFKIIFYPIFSLLGAVIRVHLARIQEPMHILHCSNYIHPLLQFTKQILQTRKIKQIQEKEGEKERKESEEKKRTKKRNEKHSMKK